MHWVIPFAVPLGDGGWAVARTLTLPRLQALLAGAREDARDSGPATSLSPPHERALAQALGLPGGDGRVPWGAWHAAVAGAAGAAAPGPDAAWAVLTPCHWRLGSDAVTLGDPAQLGLDEAGSRALFDAAAPLLAEAGFQPRWDAPLRWLVAHPSLAGVAAPSVDRAVGRPVERGVLAEAASPAWRRLHSELQMLLHAHPLNAAREAQGLEPVNSVWLGGCGALPAGFDAAGPAAAMPHVDDRLRGPALAEDWAAWADGWRALDAALPAAGPGDRLTVCGEHGYVRYALGAAQAPGPWARLRAALWGRAAPGAGSWDRWEGL